jgi:hypothetical protein
LELEKQDPFVVNLKTWKSGVVNPTTGRISVWVVGQRPTRFVFWLDCSTGSFWDFDADFVGVISRKCMWHSSLNIEGGSCITACRGTGASHGNDGQMSTSLMGQKEEDDEQLHF